jgi:cytochrome c oxidase subunit I
LLASAVLFLFNLASHHWQRQMIALPPMRYALAVSPPGRIPAALNGFGLWNVLVLALMLAAYGYPIAQFFILKAPQAVVHHVDGTR